MGKTEEKIGNVMMGSFADTIKEIEDLKQQQRQKEKALSGQLVEVLTQKVGELHNVLNYFADGSALPYHTDDEKTALNALKSSWEDLKSSVDVVLANVRVAKRSGVGRKNASKEEKRATLAQFIKKQKDKFSHSDIQEAMSVLRNGIVPQVTFYNSHLEDLIERGVVKEIREGGKKAKIWFEGVKGKEVSFEDEE
jgi:hypothetical protein